MPAGAYRALLAATNMKQRVRKLLEYTWADRLGYAVIGTPNLLEYDQGFFVKGGDGLADVKPIAGLYKRQVYALAQRARPARRDRRARADDGDLQPAADPGGVLLRPSVRADGPARLGARRRRRRRASSRRASALDAGRGRGRLRGDRAPPRRDRVPARAGGRARPRGLTMCGIAGIVRARARARRSTSDALLRMARRDPPSRARRLRPRARRRRRARLDAAGDLRPPRRLAADARRARRSLLVYNGEVYNHPELRAELERRGDASSTTCDTEVVLRLLERDGPRTRSTASTASSRSPGGSRSRAG